MYIDILERQHSPSEIAEYAKQKASSSSLLSTLLSALHDEPEQPYECIYQIYFPIFIADVHIQRKQTDTEVVTDDFTLVINGITGSVGRETAIPTSSTQDVDSTAVIDPIIDKPEVRLKVDEWLFKHFDRSHRLFQMPTYDLNVNQRYLLYWLVDRGSFATSYVINDLTERSDDLDQIKGIDEYYWNQLSSDT